MTFNQQELDSLPVQGESIRGDYDYKADFGETFDAQIAQMSTINSVAEYTYGQPILNDELKKLREMDESFLVNDDDLNAQRMPDMYDMYKNGTLMTPGKQAAYGDKSVYAKWEQYFQKMEQYSLKTPEAQHQEGLKESFKVYNENTATLNNSSFWGGLAGSAVGLFQDPYQVGGMMIGGQWTKGAGFLKNVWNVGRVEAVSSIAMEVPAQFAELDRKRQMGIDYSTKDALYHGAFNATLGTMLGIGINGLTYKTGDLVSDFFRKDTPTLSTEMRSLNTDNVTELSAHLDNMKAVENGLDAVHMPVIQEPRMRLDGVDVVEDLEPRIRTAQEPLNGVTARIADVAEVRSIQKAQMDASVHNPRDDVKFNQEGTPEVGVRLTEKEKKLVARKKVQKQEALDLESIKTESSGAIKALREFQSKKKTIQKSELLPDQTPEQKMQEIFPEKKTYDSLQRKVQTAETKANKASPKTQQENLKTANKAKRIQSASSSIKDNPDMTFEDVVKGRGPDKLQANEPREILSTDYGKPSSTLEAQDKIEMLDALDHKTKGEQNLNRLKKTHEQNLREQPLKDQPMQEDVIDTMTFEEDGQLTSYKQKMEELDAEEASLREELRCLTGGTDGV